MLQQIPLRGIPNPLMIGREKSRGMKQEEQEEPEMLIGEIPHATSPHPNRHHRQMEEELRHHPLDDGPGFAQGNVQRGWLRSPSVRIPEMYAGGITNDPLPPYYGYDGRRVFGVAPLGSDRSSSSSTSTSGTPSTPMGEDGFSPELSTPDVRRSSVAIMEQWLIDEKARLNDLVRAVHLTDEWDLAASAVGSLASAASFGSDSHGSDGVCVGGSVWGGNRVDVAVNGLTDYPSMVPQQHCLQPCSLSRQPQHSVSSLRHGDVHCSNSISSPCRHGDVQLQRNSVLGRTHYYTGTQESDYVLPMHTVGAIQSFQASQQKGVYYAGGCDAFYSNDSPHTVLRQRHSDFSTLSQPMGGSIKGYNPQSRSPEKILRGGLKAFAGEDSFILQGKELQCVVSNSHESLRGPKKLQLEERLHSRGYPAVDIKHVRSPGAHGFPLKYESLMDIRGLMYDVAQDQHGCRFLQSKFNEGTLEERDLIFYEIIEHAAELMMNPFGNYLMQKVLEVCTEKQRMEILHVLTKGPTDLVRISLNTHGTRAVQKLIEMLKTRALTTRVILALQPGFLDLIKDLNGNHVIQRCLQHFCYEDNKFIFDAAAKNCVDIATHQHGCCVLQRCLDHSTGEYRAKLMAEVSMNGLLLAQDAFGNYVVQYVLDLRNPMAIATIMAQFEGNFVNLSIQKFSSNVVEKCFHVFDEEGRKRIIDELLKVPRFEQLLSDPYANFVIKAALTHTKGRIVTLLRTAIVRHDYLRTSPHCKQIFSLLYK